jgi:hypothetical protein
VAGPRTRTIDGQKFLSRAGLAERLGVSKRTVQRMELDGRLRRPKLMTEKTGTIRSGQEAWYSPSEVQEALAVLAQVKEEQKEAAEAAQEQARHRAPQRGPWQPTGERSPAPKRWQKLQDANAEEADETPLLKPEQCPHCGGRDTIVHVLEPIPGARTAFGEVVFCEKCNQEIVPEVEAEIEQDRWGSWGQAPNYPASAFFPATSTTSPRRRPEPLTSVRGAVREQPRPKPRIEIPLPPLS